MSKRKRRDRGNAITTMKPAVQQETRITPQPTSEGITPTAQPTFPVPSADSGATWRWVFFVGLVLCLTAATIALTFLTGGPANEIATLDVGGKKVANKRAQRPAWQPMDEEDRLIDRYVQARANNREEAQTWLAALPATDRPISEEQFEEWAAGLFLRDAKLTISDICKGDPDRNGDPRPIKGRYMFTMRGVSQTPHAQVLETDGKSSPTMLNMQNPVIVVEVIGGKGEAAAAVGRIRPLRTEINRD